MKKVLIINGPNLNMLGKRKKEHYGTQTLEQINNELKEYAPFELEFFQSNHEGSIIDKIQEGFDYDALIINPGGYTHTSVAIHDALEMLPIVKVEVHLSDIYSRDSYRSVNFVKDVVDFSIYGQHERGYFLAIDYLKKCFNML